MPDAIPPSQIHVFIVDPDASVAQAVGALAVEVLPAAAETLVARSTSVAGAKRLIGQVAHDEGARLIVVCASAFPDGTSGLEVLAHARAKDPRTRVVLMTNGERDAFVTAIAAELDAVVTKPEPLDALRAVLHYLGHDAAAGERPRVATKAEPGERAELVRAMHAMTSALDAVERAHDALRRSESSQTRAAQAWLREAEILAVAAHRRMLDAQRRIETQQA